MKSPRIRYHICLPDEAPPSNHSVFAYLALLVVIVNIAACLIAERSVDLAELEDAKRGIIARQVARAQVDEDAAPNERTPHLSLFERVDRLWRQ